MVYNQLGTDSDVKFPANLSYEGKIVTVSDSKVQTILTKHSFEMSP